MPIRPAESAKQRILIRIVAPNNRSEAIFQDEQLLEKRIANIDALRRRSWRSARPRPAALTTAALEKAFGTLRGVGDVAEVFSHGRLHDVGTVEEGEANRCYVGHDDAVNTDPSVFDVTTPGETIAGELRHPASESYFRRCPEPFEAVEKQLFTRRSPSLRVGWSQGGRPR